MCFYCWECSPRNANDRKDAYYSMTICCISKNILTAIIWLFSIRLIFDLIFTIIFAIFEIPVFLFLTLIVGFALILAILGYKFKFLWIYYIFGIFTIILLILDFGSLSYIIYSLIDGNGWLYNYAQKHISTKSDDSIFEISDRKYMATDIILIIFAIFLLISFLHDLTNLLMIHRSTQYLKRFYTTNFNNTKPQRNLSRINSNNRNRLDSIQPAANGRYTYTRTSYTKRPSDLSMPSIVAPQIGSTPRLSYIDLYQEPITPKVTTIIHHPQQPHHQQHHQQHQQQPEEEVRRRPEVLVNGGYSFVEPIHPRRTISTNTAVTTPGYEKPGNNSRVNVTTTEYVSLFHQNVEENQRIQEQDTRNPFGDNSKKNDSKNDKSQPIQPNEVPPLPPKITTFSTISQPSESSSFIYENTVINNFDQEHHIPILPSFVPIPFKPNSNVAKSDSSQESDDSPFDSSFDEPPSNWGTEEAKVSAAVRQNEIQIDEKQTNFSNINPVLSSQRYDQNVQQPSPTSWGTNIAPVTHHESYLTKVETNQSHIIYSNINPALSPPNPNNNSSDGREQQYSNPINSNPAKTIADEDPNDDDDDNYETASNNSNDVVSFWSKHPSTRRRRASKDLLNEKGFLSDSSEEEDKVDKEKRIPKLLLSTNKSQKQQQPLKSYGLTQILQLEKKQEPTMASVNNENQFGKEIRSNSLIFALQSIKVMEENEKEEDKKSSHEYQYQSIKTEAKIESHRVDKMEHKDYGIHQETKTITHSNYENLPHTTTESSTSSMIKRESLSFQQNEINKSEHFKTPVYLFHRNVEAKKELPAVTPETPIIPSTSNFFDAWGKAADKNLNDSKTTVPLNKSSLKIDENESENIVNIARKESERSDSTMNFSSSSDEDSESDFDTRYEKLKLRLQAHLPQTINNKQEVVVVTKNDAISSSDRGDTVTTNVESVSSIQKEQPILFRRLPLIGNDRVPAEIFSTPPTSPMHQIPSTNFQQPPLPSMPPPRPTVSTSHQIAHRISISSSSSQSLKSINEN